MKNNYQSFIPYIPITVIAIVSIFVFFKFLSYEILSSDKFIQRLRPGFTIIEVVVVLAIAALILAVVLTAVAGLQRSQRTKAAQYAAGRLLTQELGYESDQGGNASQAIGYTLPASYVTNAALPSGATTTVGAASPGTAASGVGNYVYGPGGCDAGNNKVVGAASSTVFAVAYYSETGGISICIHN